MRSFVCQREQCPKPLDTVLFELVLPFLWFFLSTVFNRWCLIPDSFQNIQKKVLICFFLGSFFLTFYNFCFDCLFLFVVL
jgi:hypothetical protein